MIFLNFLIVFFVVLCIQCAYAENLLKESNPPYINNPLFNHIDTTKPAIPIGPPHHIVGKHTLNQYQVSVLLPGGKDGEPPSYANVQGIPHAGGIWINLPGDYYDQRDPYRPPPGVYQPPIQQPPPTTTTVVYTYPPSTTYTPFTTTTVPPATSYEPPYTPSATVGTTPDPQSLLRWCLRPVGQFPSRFCNKFVNCWDGNAIEQFCPPTLVFNPKGYCDYDYNVDCQGRPIEAFPTQAPQHSSGKWPTDGSYVPPELPVSGENYYPTTTRRPYGPIIEPITPPPYPISIPPPITIPQPNPALRKYCLKHRGQFPGTRCNRYVNCWDDVVIEEQCPDTLVFNGAKGWCDFPENVRCYDQILEPLILPLLKGPNDYIEQQCPLSDGTFRSAHDCSKYYTCVKGQISATYNCPAGYVFNDLIGICDYPHRVDCTREPNAYYPLNLDTNILQRVPADLYNPESTCKPGTVIRLDPECVSAAICRSGTTEVIQCPEGLSYDSVTDKCLAPHLAKC